MDKASRIVVGVDGSAGSDAAVRWAARDAALRGAELAIVYAAPPLIGTWLEAPVSADVLAWQQQQGERFLRDAVGIAEREGGAALSITTDLMTPMPVQALLAASDDALMVVVGSRGRGRLARALLGSVSMGLVHHARCPVAVIRATTPDSATGETPSADAPVLVGVDGSPASDLATELAFDEASRRGVGLIALHAWWSPGAFELPGSEWETLRAEVEKSFNEQIAAWRAAYPLVAVQTVVVLDEPAHELVERSHTAQLVVVGSRGHGGIGSVLLGSVSTAVVQAVRIPVIVARS